MNPSTQIRSSAASRSRRGATSRSRRKTSTGSTSSSPTPSTSATSCRSTRSIPSTTARRTTCCRRRARRSRTGLLVRALEETGKVGIAKVVIRNKQHLAALRTYEGVLLLETMYYADEVRDPQSLDGDIGSTRVQKAEVEMAKSLVENLSDTFKPEKYDDKYRKELLDLIKAKAKGKTLPEPAGGAGGRGRRPDGGIARVGRAHEEAAQAKDQPQGELVGLDELARQLDRPPAPRARPPHSRRSRRRGPARPAARQRRRTCRRCRSVRSWSSLRTAARPSRRRSPRPRCAGGGTCRR